MSQGTMTSKGQLTVPKDVRDALGLTAGTTVEFTPLDDGGYRFDVSRGPHRLLDLAGILSDEGGAGRVGAVLSVADMHDVIASEASRAAAPEPKLR